MEDILIYIDDKEKLDASVVANSFTDNDTKNRAYINTLGADLLSKYLALENIDTSKTYNIHSIKKILEDTDISDIRLGNITIDVRIVFDENIIFIPKAHFEYEITPDVYVIFHLAQDFTSVKFLGFFEPKLINKNNQNEDYYFIEKEKLTPAHELVNFISNHEKSEFTRLSEEELTNSEQIMVSMADYDITQEEKAYLLKQLTKSSALIDRFIEYENFETLASKAAKDSITTTQNFENFNDDIFEDFNNITFDAPATESTDNLEAIENIDIETDVPQINNDIDEIETLETENIDLGNITELTSDDVESNVDGIADIGSDLVSLENIDNLGIDQKDETFEANTALDEIQINSETLTEVNLELDTLPLETLNETAETIEIENNTFDVENIDTEHFETKESSEPDTLSLDGLPESNETEENSEPDTLSLDELPESIETEEINNDINNIEALDTNIEKIELTENFEPDMLSLDALNESTENTENINIEEVELTDKFELETLPEANTELLDINFDATLDETVYDNNINIENAEVTNLVENINIQDELEQIELPKEELINIEDDIIEDIESANINNNNSDDFDIEKYASLNEIPEITNNEEIGNTNYSNENIVRDYDELDDIVADIIKEQGTDSETPSSESFGKNLLENLSVEELDNIPLEELGINTSETQNEAFSTEDLLSQIDNVLETNTQVNEDNTETIDNTNIDNIEENPSTDISTTPDTLEVLFNNETAIDDEQSATEIQEETDNIPTQNYVNTDKSKKALFAAVLIAAIIGTSAFFMLKPKDEISSNIEEDIDIINSTTTPNEILQPTQDIDNNQVENNIPEITQPIKKEEIQNAKQQEFTPKKMPTDAPYLTVNRLVWNISNNLSDNPKIQNYLKSAGKSIKLSLSADLLLATEYAYTNQVKVSLKINKNGSIENANIASSCGSNEIDNIVLQSVKETLNVVKPPSDVINTPNFDLNLIIYL